MKLKTATLIALISTVVLIVHQLISVCYSLDIIDHIGHVGRNFFNILALLAFCGIGFFFFTLYKNQK